MKQVFYVTSVLSVIAIIVGLVQFHTFRDKVYLLAMLFMFVAIVSGLAYLVGKKNWVYESC